MHNAHCVTTKKECLIFLPTCRLFSQVKSFSQLRNDFYETDTFYLGTGEQTTVRGAKVTREGPRVTPPEQRKPNKILRRHNSEPILQGERRGEWSEWERVGQRREFGKQMKC